MNRRLGQREGLWVDLRQEARVAIEEVRAEQRASQGVAADAVVGCRRADVAEPQRGAGEQPHRRAPVQVEALLAGVDGGQQVRGREALAGDHLGERAVLGNDGLDQAEGLPPHLSSQGGLDGAEAVEARRPGRGVQGVVPDPGHLGSEARVGDPLVHEDVRVSAQLLDRGPHTAQVQRQASDQGGPLELDKSRSGVGVLEFCGLVDDAGQQEHAPLYPRVSPRGWWRRS